jgi:hypothetical protein
VAAVFAAVFAAVLRSCRDAPGSPAAGQHASLSPLVRLLPACGTCPSVDAPNGALRDRACRRRRLACVTVWEARRQDVEEFAEYTAEKIVKFKGEFLYTSLLRKLLQVSPPFSRTRSPRPVLVICSLSLSS